MNNHKSIQILRGAESYDPTTSEEILLDGQPFYSKKTKQLYIGDGVTPLKDLKSIDTGLNLATDDNLNTLIQSMEPGKNPNIAAGRSDVVFGRYNIGDSRTLNADGSVKDKGDSLFVAGVQNKNYGNRSAQFGSYNENHSLGSFQAGYNNKILDDTQYVAQFGTNNLAKHSGVFQTGSYNISGRDGQFQAGTLAEGNAENRFEIGGGGRFTKSSRDDNTLINDSYYIRTGDSYEKITADNIDSISSTAQVYYLKNLFEINTDGTAKIAKQGDSENSLVIKKTLDNYKPINSYEGTAGLSFSIISEEEKNCEVSNGNADSEEMIIPSYVFINGTQYTVTSIKNTGFRTCANIKIVVIPETVTKIGNQAFEGCTNLVSIKIPSSVVELGSTVFTNCDSLEEIEIPDSVTTITPMSGFPRILFSHCNALKRVTLGKNITNIPYQCFIGCSNLTDIIIKGEIKTVYNQAFNGVENATIWVNADLVDYYKTLLKNHTSLPVKPYRDILELSEKIEEVGGTTVTVNGEAAETFDADTKLNKVTTTSNRNRVYAVDASGNQFMYESTASVVPSSLIARTSAGQIKVHDVPATDNDATSKKYVDNKFNGANKAVSFNNYSEMITSLMAEETASYSVGQNIMIVTLNVPDLWVSGIVDDNNYYEYSSDEAFLQDLKDFESIPVGHYYLSALETQKVDLTDYAKTSGIYPNMRVGESEDVQVLREVYEGAYSPTYYGFKQVSESSSQASGSIGYITFVTE